MYFVTSTNRNEVRNPSHATNQARDFDKFNPLYYFATGGSSGARDESCSTTVLRRAAAADRSRHSETSVNRLQPD
eukprot:16493-Amphidinium_carterae.1